MPIYDYTCNCGTIKLDELVRKYDDVVLCDDCSAIMEKGLGAPALLGFDSNGSSKKSNHGQN